MKSKYAGAAWNALMANDIKTLLAEGEALIRSVGLATGCTSDQESGGVRMTRFCYLCGRAIADAKRIAKGGIFCSPECKRAHEREKRNARAKQFCRLCGRRYYRPRTKAVLPPPGPAQGVLIAGPLSHP